MESSESIKNPLIHELRINFNRNVKNFLNEFEKKTVFTHPWKYCTGKFSSKGMIINRETRFEFFHYSRREGPYSTGIRASHEPVNQLNRYGPRSKVATIEGSATAISEASIITANHGWLSRPISIEDGWGRAEILIKWPMNYWHGWGGRWPLFRVGEIKKKGRRGGKKKRKKLLVDAIKCRRPSFPAMPPQETRRPARFTSKRRAPRCVRDSFPLIGNVCPNGR